MSIKEYITHIFYAEKIFTASYHGMMFSLIFNKQFSFYPFAPSTRMISVAKKYGLEDYNICSKKYDLDKDIVYDNINPLIEKFRDDSLKCLKRMLNEVV